MIMRPGQALLLPARPAFIWASLTAALALNMLANMGLWGRAAWAPDWLALALVFWTVHQPFRVGMTAAFALGLVLDVHQGALLGQHALSYSVLSYLAIAIHRRVLWFGMAAQSAHIGGLFLVSHALEWTIRAASGAGFPSWTLALAPLIEAALWPVATALLLAPQRQAPDPDADRPL